MVTKSLSGGEVLKKRLKELAAKVGKPGVLQVGFMEGATYPDGTSVPMVAAVNEFGGTIPAREVPEHTAEIYHRVLKNGTFADEGRFSKKSKSNFERTVTIPAHTIPEYKIPARPFFRAMIASESPAWGDKVAEQLIGHDYDGIQALQVVGEDIAGALAKSIRDFTDPPNAPSTIAKKGFDKPLIDTGHMVASITAIVKGETP